MVEVNLLGVIWGSRAAVEAMRPRGGDIVNMASMSSFGPVPGLAVYGATKHAVLGLHRVAPGRPRRRGHPDPHPCDLPGRRRHRHGARAPGRRGLGDHLLRAALPDARRRSRRRPWPRSASASRWSRSRRAARAGAHDGAVPQAQPAADAAVQEGRRKEAGGGVIPGRVSVVTLGACDVPRPARVLREPRLDQQHPRGRRVRRLPPGRRRVLPLPDGPARRRSPQPAAGPRRRFAA